MNRFFTGITLGVPKSLHPLQDLFFFFFLEDLVLLSSQNLLLLRRKSKRHLNIVRLEKKPFSYHIPPHWLCLHNTRMQQCSLIFKASPAQSDQQFEFVLPVWVSRCSHMASGSFVVVVIREAL